MTMQVARNKSIFGLIDDRKCVLNELGQQVQAAWRNLSQIHRESYFDEFVIMPNHVHAIVRVGPARRPGPHDIELGTEARPHDIAGTEAHAHDIAGDASMAPHIIVAPGLRAEGLSKIIHSFKSFTSNKIYHVLVREGRVPSIGPSLWQESFYDNLITGHTELERIRAYIRNNPAKWDDDRFGAVTAYQLGNVDLLNGKLTAYVASALAPARRPGPHDIGLGTETRPHDIAGAASMAPHTIVAPGLRAGGCVISTFTSPQEREVLRQCLAGKWPFVWVRPGGLPTEIFPNLQVALDEGRALLLSPVPSGTGVNKQRAILCNRYVIKHAREICHGQISRGGMLETLLKAKGIRI